MCRLPEGAVQERTRAVWMPSVATNLCQRQTSLSSSKASLLARLHWSGSPNRLRAGVLPVHGRLRSIISIIRQECVMSMSEPWDLCDESVTKV